MGRSTIDFLTVVLPDFLDAIGHDPADTAADATRRAVRSLNAAYRQVYQLAPWEDTWSDGAKTPSSGVIAWADVGNAFQWNLWSADPRDDGNRALWLRSTHADTGIQVLSDAYSGTVHAFWRPECPTFDGTTEDREFVALLRDPVLLFAQAEYARAAAQWQTANALRKDGQRILDELMETEFYRLQGKPWLKGAY